MKIVWSTEAQETFAEIIAYIDRKFTQREVDKFIVATFETLELCKMNPEMFPVSGIKKFDSARKAVIHPHSSVFYQINDDRTVVSLITFWDNRNNPANIK